jgi:hypothetical protein
MISQALKAALGLRGRAGRNQTTVVTKPGPATANEIDLPEIKRRIWRAIAERMRPERRP